MAIELAARLLAERKAWPDRGDKETDFAEPFDGDEGIRGDIRDVDAQRARWARYRQDQALIAGVGENLAEREPALAQCAAQAKAVRAGRLVVFELKRTTDGGHLKLQALRYAAMVSVMTLKT